MCKPSMKNEQEFLAENSWEEPLPKTVNEPVFLKNTQIEILFTNTKPVSQSKYGTCKQQENENCGQQRL